MAWTYDASDLSTETAGGRLNATRLLVGDTDTNDQQVQDEEITFALAQTSNNVYNAASWLASVIASKYARRVDTDLDGQLSEKYSQLQDHYARLSVSLSQQGKRFSGASLGSRVGGVSQAAVNAVRGNTDRVSPFARMDRFRIEDNPFLSDWRDE